MLNCRFRSQHLSSIKSRAGMALVLMIIAVLGVMSWQASKADTGSVISEAETAKGVGTSLKADGRASGGSALVFGPEKASFKLYSPGWQGIADGWQNHGFSVIYGRQDPASIHALSAGATASYSALSFKYTLGPYVTADYVPCAMIPSGATTTHCGTKSTPGNSCTTPGSLPQSAIAKDASGMAVYATGYTNNFLIVPDDPGLICFITAQTKVDILYPNGDAYDGLLTDSMGTGPIDSNYLNAKPINPNTGQLYTPSEWMQAERQLVAAKRAGLPNGTKLLMNGLAKGNKYWSGTVADGPREILDQVDGAMAESIWRDATQDINTWQNAAGWLSDVTMMEDVENTYHLPGYYWTKCYDGTNFSCKNNSDPNKDALIQQWLRFCVASFLIGAQSHSYFNFDVDRFDSNTTEYYPEYDVAKKLGPTTAARTKIGTSVGWQRTYDHGLVAVNPGTTTISIDVGAQTYTDFDAKTVSGTLSIPAHTGVVLIDQ